MQTKEEKMCSYTQKGNRLQLVKIISEELNIYGEPYTYIRYQLRLNRKIQHTSLNEYTMRKLFAQMVTNIVLQLKIID